MAINLESLIEPATTVLVMQECQVGVIGEQSVLPALADECRGGLIPKVAELAASARAVGVRVIHANAVHRPDLWGANTNSRLMKAAHRSPVKLHSGTEAAQTVPEIGLDPSDIVYERQRGLSPFQGTELDFLFRNAGVTTLVVVGVSLNVAIPNTTFDAVNAGYQVVIPRDAVVGTPTDYGQAVLDNTLGLISTLTTTDDIVAVWSG